MLPCRDTGALLRAGQGAGGPQDGNELHQRLRIHHGRISAAPQLLPMDRAQGHPNSPPQARPRSVPASCLRLGSSQLIPRGCRVWRCPGPRPPCPAPAPSLALSRTRHQAPIPLQSPNQCRHPQGCSGEGLGCREPASAEQRHFAIKLGVLQLSVCLSVCPQPPPAASTGQGTGGCQRGHVGLCREPCSGGFGVLGGNTSTWLSPAEG